MTEPVVNDDPLFKFFIEKHKELEDKSVLKDRGTDDISMDEINNRLCEYMSNRSWAIVEYKLADRSYRTAKRLYSQWEDSKIIEIRKKLKEEDPKSKEPARWIIDAKITELYPVEKNSQLQELDDLELRMTYFKNMKETWADQKDILQTLANNIRTDMKNFETIKKQPLTPSLERMKQKMDENNN